MMFFKNFIKKFASQYSKLQLYEIILKKRISFWRKNVNKPKHVGIENFFYNNDMIISFPIPNFEKANTLLPKSFNEAPM